MVEYTDYGDRAKRGAIYIIENRATIRSAAKYIGISKSTLHKDISERLPKVCPELCAPVREILDINQAQRHLRGGLATKNKYLNRKKTEDQSS